MRYLIIDSHVIMKTQTVEQHYYRLPERLRNGFLRAILDYVSSGCYITEDDVTPIFVYDWKDSNRKYWRHYEYQLWLDSLEKKGDFVYVVLDGEKKRRKPAPYKYGRKFPSKTSQKYYRNFYDIVGEYFAIGQKGFEADDIAGEIIRNLSEDDTADLVTIDSDWLGLVKPGQVGFYNIIDYQPGNRYRQTLEAVMDTTACRGYNMQQCSDIWEFKSKDGDKSDRLLPGTPIGLISLLEPSIRPNTVDLSAAESRKNDGSRAKEYLKKVGFYSFF